MGVIRSPQSGLFGPDVLEGYEDDELRVQIVPKELADALIRRNHYSKATCWASSLHFGVFAQSGALLGALQYGPPMNSGSVGHIVRDSTYRNMVELNRMWLRDEKPANTATRAISFSIRVIRSMRPQVDWVMSFADERCGKLGAVYQAASFLYCGEHDSTFYELDGEWFHKSAIGRGNDNRGNTPGQKIKRFNANIDRAVPHTFRQFRYIRPLTASARKRLLLPVLPYPKPAEDLRLAA